MSDSTRQNNNANSIILKIIKKFRYTSIIEFIFKLFCFTIFLILVLNLMELVIWKKLTTLLLADCLLSYIFFNSERYQAISSKNLLEHINRHFPDYQESTHLLLTDAKNLLEMLQKDKIEKQLIKDYQQGRFVKIIPKINFKLSISLLILAFFVFISGNELKSIFSFLDNKSDLLEKQDGSSGLIKKQKPTLKNIRIEISPPSYTELKESISKSLDFEVPEGSRVSWLLEFSNSDLKYTYNRSGNSEKIFENKDTQFLVKDTIYQTSLYRIGYRDQHINQNQPTNGHLNGIYSIAMLRDQLPKIEIIEPSQTLIEIPKMGLAEFSLQAKIDDDYGVSNVTILASVAKGSGEAVKFRDKKFKFDESAININSYYKHWSLLDLGMEPGDEVYFSIVATDNKQPTAQTRKSSSIIVRWLDNDEVEMAAEGIKINFVPEYFRSQRQIIIETEQLIVDKKDLHQVEFQETSEELGHSQSDLKQKYGQYLGDEFGEGPEEQFGLADGYHGGESLSAGEATAGINSDSRADKDHLENKVDPKENHQSKIKEADHEHQETKSLEPTSPIDLSGANQLIQRFTHNHGTVEVGPMSNRDPKSWMKMAVSEMWQAELHLMQGQPEKALPYEHEAYKFLKLARQAERIYAKRLGFEPPPVTEERRLTGELMGILEYDLSYIDKPNNETDNALFKQAHQFLFSQRDFSEHQINLFKRLSTRLLKLSEKRPVLVKYAAITEQIVINKSITLNHCEQCITQLRNKLWQLLPLPISLPNTENKQHGFSKEIQVQYIKALEELKTTNNQGLNNE